MKHFMPILFGVILLSCSQGDERDAFLCRGALKEGDDYRMSVVIQVQDNFPAISYAPVRCQNLEVSFNGMAANSSLSLMSSLAKASPGGRATFQIEAVGGVKRDDHLQIPVFAVKKVISLSRIH